MGLSSLRDCIQNAVSEVSLAPQMQWPRPGDRAQPPTGSRRRIGQLGPLCGQGTQQGSGGACLLSPR